MCVPRGTAYLAVLGVVFCVETSVSRGTAIFEGLWACFTWNGVTFCSERLFHVERCFSCLVICDIGSITVIMGSGPKISLQLAPIVR